MKKIYLLVIILFVIINAAAFYFINYSNHLIDKENVKKRLESAVSFSKLMMEKEQKFALSLSIILAENPIVKQALITNNKKSAYEELTRTINKLEPVRTIEDIEIQIHNADFETFLTTVDFNSQSIPIDPCITGIEQTKDSMKPMVSIGMREQVTIRAISPIIENSVYLGSIEVILDFENLTKILKDNGIDFLIFLDRKHLPSVMHLVVNPEIYNYIIVNPTQNKSNMLYFQELSQEQFLAEDILKLQDKCYTKYELYDIEYLMIGYAVIGLNKNNCDHFVDTYQNFYENFNPQDLIITTKHDTNHTRKVDIK